MAKESDNILRATSPILNSLIQWGYYYIERRIVWTASV